MDFAELARSKVRRFTVMAYDGSGRTIHSRITLDHDFFKKKFTPDEGWQRPTDMVFPMDHTFGTGEGGLRYRIVLDGVFDR